jgi:hypothetical protein
MIANAVYIIPPFPIFQNKSLPFLENFNDEDKITLYSNLYLNLIENFSKDSSKFTLFCIFDRSDKEFLPSDFDSKGINKEFIDISDLKTTFAKLSEKHFLKYKNNILIRSNVMGINSNDTDRLFNLLTIDDEALVVSKTENNIISLLGFNNYTEVIFNNLIKSEFNYERFLYHLNPISHFIQIVNETLMIHDLDDFKKLYQYLSQKKSIEYCSQEMHERFTNLFIEYKDLLK